MKYNPIDAQIHQAMTGLAVVKGYAQLLAREAAKGDSDMGRTQGYAARVQFEVDRLASTLAQLQRSIRSRQNGAEKGHLAAEPQYSDEG